MNMKKKTMKWQKTIQSKERIKKTQKKDKKERIKTY